MKKPNEDKKLSIEDMITEFKNENVVSNVKMTKQQIILTEKKDIIIKLLENDFNDTNIAKFFNDKLKVEEEIKVGHLKTFFKNNSELKAKKEEK
jgi:hypothetical protein